MASARTKTGTNGHRRRSKTELSRLLSNAKARKRIPEGLMAVGDLATPTDSAPKEESLIDTERIVIARRARYNPLRTLTPELLTVHLEAFRMGYLWQFALDADAMRRRDLILCGAALKREKAISRHGFDIVTDEDSLEAKKHAAALKYFYTNARATDALDQNVKGGYSLLIRQMMRAVGFQFQVHEIIWKPEVDVISVTDEVKQADGSYSTEEVARMDGITAEFRAVPLWFFECITGKLRYLRQFGELYGQPMEEGGWLVTASDIALMEPSAVAYMYKNLTLKDWLSLSERWGDPKVYGVTDGKPNSPQWNAMADAIKNIAEEYAAVVGKGGEIKTLDGGSATGAGESIYEKLVNQMDRYITTLWRGGDLSTISHQGGGEGQGASLQGGESDILEVDDCDFIEETLHSQVDHWVIRYLFGEGVTPKAHIVIARPERKDTKLDLEVDTFITTGGGKQKLKTVAERYGREVTNPDEDFGVKAPTPEPKPAAETLTPEEIEAAVREARTGAPAKEEKPEEKEEEVTTLASSMEDDKLLAEYANAVDADLYAPVREKYGDLLARLKAVTELSNDAEMQAALDKLKPELKAMQADLPKMLPRNPLAAGVLRKAITQAFVRGATQEPVGHVAHLKRSFQPLKNSADLPVSCKAIILDDQHRVLLLKDANSDYWDLPGGHMKDGEKITDALIREVKEETGLTVTDAALHKTLNLELGSNSTPTSCVFFNASSTPDAVVVSKEHLAHAWVAASDLAKYNLGAFAGVLAGLKEVATV